MQQKHTVKDRSATEARILAAFRELIQERGFHDAGINAVAERAGVNKVLIYRYFSGMGGLCARLAKELDLSALNHAESIALGIDPGSDLKPQLLSGLKSFHHRLASDEFSLALMTEEISGENQLTHALAAEREQAGSALSAIIKESIDKNNTKKQAGDIQARLAVVSAALYYLTLRARGVRLFNGIDIQSDEGWNRLYAAMADMIPG